MKTLNSVLLLTLVSASTAFAGTLLVDNDKVECPDAGFTSIQTAVDAAASGDTVQVCPGTYDEQVEIAKPLSLVGVKRAGKNAAVVQPSNMQVNTDLQGYPQASAILVRDTSGVTIRNVTIDGINNGVVCSSETPYIDGIFYRNASGEVASVVVKNFLSPEGGCAFGDGIDVVADAGAWKVTIRDSSIHDYDSGGILGIGTGTSLSAIGNVVTGQGPTESGQGGIQIYGGGTGSIEQNIVTNHITVGCPACGFISSNILIFEAEDATIVGNTVSASNAGMYVGGFGDFGATRATVLDNNISGASPFSGMFVLGNDNLVQGNVITNSGSTGVSMQGANNTVTNNTVNEAFLGILSTTGNNIFQNKIFNTTRTVKVYSLDAPDGDASQAQPPLAPSILRKGRH